MNEAFTVDCDTDVQFLAREMHEYEIPRLQLMAANGKSGMQLFLRRPR